MKKAEDCYGNEKRETHEIIRVSNALFACSKRV